MFPQYKHPEKFYWVGGGGCKDWMVLKPNNWIVPELKFVKNVRQVGWMDIFFIHPL